MSDLRDSSRPEAAFVLMLMQSTFWFAAGVSAFPFVLAGEVWMAALGLASFVLAGLGCLLAIGLIRRSLRSRKWTLVLEGVCLVGSALLLAVPIGANRGPVSLMVNIALPLAVLILLRGKKMRAGFLSADAGAPAGAGGCRPAPREGQVRVSPRHLRATEVAQREPVAGGLGGRSLA